MTSLTKNRIESIDILRGIAMVIMALDHVRDFFHIGANTANPLDPTTTTFFLFFTRWITHFCAPVFVFLSGTSIFLQSQRKTKKELSAFLITRGLWLIFVEVVIITFAWSFNPNYTFHFLQVIWAIGISMVILGMLIYLPFKALLAIGMVIVLGHNALDFPESAPDFKAGFLWDLLHHGAFVPYEYAPGHSLFLVYPFVAWLGLMILGYCFGVFFTEEYSYEQRKKIFIRLGVSILLFFVALRFTNAYGDPHDWSPQKNFLFTVLSFVNVNKYPASLLFMCLMIGPALILLPYLEKVKNWFSEAMRTFGRVAFFYYILHLYLIHAVAAMVFFARGHTMEEATASIQSQFPFYFIIPGEGFNLPMVYLIWILVVVSLYPLCKWYDQYKTKHREKKWLSYL
jgi:uncharacterized membrane protein